MNQMMAWIWRSITEENGPTNLKKKKDKQLKIKKERVVLKVKIFRFFTAILCGVNAQMDSEVVPMFGLPIMRPVMSL